MKKKYRSPDFYGIGVMKGGTTWTWKQMRKHPSIGTPKNPRGKRIKEFHFFDRLNIPLKRYLKCFGRLKHECVGEFTPNYFSCPYAPPLIKTYFPNVKLFVLLRNPIDRAFSHYKDHLWYKKIEPEVSFMDAFDGNHPKGELSPYSIKSKGMYGDLLENWYRYFEPDRIKVLFYDDMVSDPLGFLREVFKWVGVDDSFVPPDYDEKVLKKYNKAYDDMKLDPEDRKRVAHFYTPQIVKLSKLTGRKLTWS
jgi:hypothetical protein